MSPSIGEATRRSFKSLACGRIIKRRFFFDDVEEDDDDEAVDDIVAMRDGVVLIVAIFSFCFRCGFQTPQITGKKLASFFFSPDLKKKDSWNPPFSQIIGEARNSISGTKFPNESSIVR